MGLAVKKDIQFERALFYRLGFRKLNQFLNKSRKESCLGKNIGEGVVGLNYFFKWFPIITFNK